MNEPPVEALLERKRVRPLRWALAWVGVYVALTAANLFLDWFPYTEGPPMPNPRFWSGLGYWLWLVRVGLFGAGLLVAAPILGVRAFKANSPYLRITYLMWLAPLGLLWIGYGPLSRMMYQHKTDAARKVARDATALVGAIEVFEHTQGRAPGSLGELIPDFLAEIPVPGIRAASEYEYVLQLVGSRTARWKVEVELADYTCTSGGAWEIYYVKAAPWLEVKKLSAHVKMPPGWVALCP